MKLSSNLWLLVLAALCAVLGACQKESNPANEPGSPKAETAARVTPEPALLAMPELVSAAPTEFKKVLTGKLDNKLALHVELERKGAKLTGSYYYEKVGAANVAEKLLSLAGKIDKEGKVTLVETAFSGDKGDEKSGEFKGALDGVTINGEQTLRFLGVWTDVKGKKSLPVTLQELRYDLGGLKFSEKQIQETNKKARLEITASVPQLSGDAAGAEAFNKTALALITKAIAQFKKDAAEAVKAEQEAATSEQKPLSQQATAAAEKSGAGQSAAPALKENKPAELPPLTFDSGYEVVYANAEMVSVLFSYSTYFGGAHPNRSSLAFNYDLKRAAEVKLPDLFAPKAGYLKVIADYSIKELKKLHTTDGVAEGAAAKAENFKRWNVTPLGLRFTFDPYQVGPYATGEHEVTVPYALLKSLANPAGWLAKLANV